jgi:hypothetical protein
MEQHIMSKRAAGELGFIFLFPLPPHTSDDITMMISSPS